MDRNLGALSVLKRAVVIVVLSAKRYAGMVRQIERFRGTGEAVELGDFGKHPHRIHASNSRCPRHFSLCSTKDRACIASVRQNLSQ